MYVGSRQLHVDLLVDQRLAVLVVVLPDLGHGHLDRLVGLGAWDVVLSWMCLESRHVSWKSWDVS